MYQDRRKNIPDRNDREWKDNLSIRLTRQDEILEELTERMGLNEESTVKLEQNTKELIEFFQSMVGAFKVFNLVGKLAKPVGALVGMFAAIGSLWLMIRGGGK